MEAAFLVAAFELVEGHQLGPERGGEVLPLARPEADGHLLALKVAGTPVVHDREAGDDLQRAVVGGDIAAFLADDAGQLELEVEHLAAERRPDRLVVADARRRGWRSRRPAPRTTRASCRARGASAARLDVLLEGVEIADAGDGGQWLSHSGGPPCRVRSKRAAQGLLALDGFEEGLEVPLAEALRTVALDDLEEERRAVLHRLGEDLQQVALFVAIDEDAEVGKLAEVFVDRADATGKQLVVGLRAPCRNDTSLLRIARTVAMMSSVAIAMCWTPGPP